MTPSHHSRGSLVALLVVALLLVPSAFAIAQRTAPAAPQQQAAPPASQQPAAQPAPTQGEGAAGQAPRRWESFAPMVLERVFRGPLRDTLVQRWRDPVDGAICFVYLPISASAAGQGAYLLYGPNTIGSISCVAPVQVIQLQGVAPEAAAPAPEPAPAAPRRR